MQSETAEGRGLEKGRWLAAALLLLAAVLTLYFRLRPQPATSGTAARPRGRGAATSDLPRIDLARLSSPPPATKAGRRDLFGFGEAEPDEDEAENVRSAAASAAEPTPIAVVTPNPETAPPPTPRLVAINLKYIGSLEAQGGIKVAVLLTDRNEILYGQVGQQVANRFKILRIGLESVEIFDEGAGQSRRIPLKGN